jgi:hypothetical protein
VDVQRPDPAKSAAVTPAATTGWCNGGGCWFRYDDFHVDFNSNQFAYGHGSTYLGSGNYYINWQLTGPKTNVGPSYVILSTATSSVVGSSALLNGAQGTSGGSLLAGPVTCCTPEWTYSHPANTRYQWPTNRLPWFRDYSAWDHNTTVRYSWHIPGYSGYWYVWARSVVSHTTARNSPDSTYRFDEVDYLTQSPYASGYPA